MKVKSKQFEVGQWVWYYYPRRYTNRSPKWSKFYDGPYLIVRRIPPCDYVIQRTKRSAQLVVHADKLKPCYGPTPTSWLPQKDQQQTSTAELMTQNLPAGVPTVGSTSDLQPRGEVRNGIYVPSVAQQKPRKKHYQALDEVALPEQKRELPSRTRRQPRHLMDFEVPLLRC